MLSWESGFNLVASIASFICVISKQWSYSGSGGQFTDTGSHSFIAKDVREFRSGQKDTDTEFSLKFAGDDSAILISVCVSTSLRFRFPT